MAQVAFTPRLDITNTSVDIPITILAGIGVIIIKVVIITTVASIVFVVPVGVTAMAFGIRAAGIADGVITRA